MTLSEIIQGKYAECKEKKGHEKAHESQPACD